MIRNNRHKKHYQPRYCAFTLIELTLVIVVIATLMLLGAHFYKQQREQTQIKQTAEDMQQIAQAAQAYYVNNVNNYWPSQLAALNGVKSCGPLYMGVGSSCGGFNNYQISYPSGYTAQGDANTGNPPTVEEPCPGGHMCFGPPPEPQIYKASIVQVSTTVPNTNIANQLALLLPMSKQQGTKVTMSVPAPNETFKDTHLTLPELYDLMNKNGVIMVKSMYTTLIGENNVLHGTGSIKSRLSKNNNRSNVTLPICPPSWYPGYDVALVQTVVNIGTNANGSRGVYICRQDQDFYPNQTGTTSFVAKTDLRTVSDYLSAVALVVTYCVPPTVAHTDENMRDRFAGYTPLKVTDEKTDASSCQFANFTSGTG